MGLFDKFRQPKSEKLIEHLEYRNSEKKINRKFFNDLKKDISDENIKTTEEIDRLVKLDFDGSAKEFAITFIELYKTTDMMKDETCYPIYYLLKNWHRKISKDKNYYYACNIYDQWMLMSPSYKRHVLMPRDFYPNKEDNPKSGNPKLDAWFVIENAKVNKLDLLNKYNKGELDQVKYNFNVQFLDETINKTLKDNNLTSEESIIVMDDNGNIDIYD